MQEEKSIFLQILDFDPGELKEILKAAVCLVYSDGIAGIEEWNLMSLIPALMDVAKTGTEKTVKKEWERKLKIAGKALEMEREHISADHLSIKNKLKSPGKQKTGILFLMLIACSDKKVHVKELEFIIENIAKPWKITKNDLINILGNAKAEIPDTGHILQMIEKYRW